jgi:hypothetical protein
MCDCSKIKLLIFGVSYVCAEYIYSIEFIYLTIYLMCE